MKMNETGSAVPSQFTTQVPEDECPAGADPLADFTLQSEAAACNERPCPVDCEVGAWGGWGPCSTSCGPGRRTRARSVTQTADHSGAECPALEDEEDCDADAACPVDCARGEWSAPRRWHEPLVHHTNMMS